MASSSADTRSHSPVGVDQAVLAGTGLIAVITANDGPGVWNPFDTLTGIVLLLIMIGFYRPIGTVDRHDARVRAAATAGVAALCCCIIVAWPIQHYIDRHPQHLFYLDCRVHHPRLSKSVCVAMETSSYVLPLVWVALSIAMYRLVLHRHRLAALTMAPAAAPTPAPEPVLESMSAAVLEPESDSDGTLPIPAPHTAPDNERADSAHPTNEAAEY